MSKSDANGGRRGFLNLRGLRKHEPALRTSPYPIEEGGDAEAALATLRGRTVFFDGVLKSDYSLAIVNRELARAMIQAGVDLHLHTREGDWETDPMLNAMADVRARCIETYPEPESYDIHLRNTWPPSADNMVGSQINAYVCFAWEELDFPPGIANHFNAHLDMVLTTASFVTESLVKSGVRVPVVTVGNGTDHLSATGAVSLAADLRPGASRRILHVSSCFPRKGADVLTQAFCATFTKSDGVELFIKTFDNPHNEIDAIVAKARAAHPNAAPIRVVKKSLPQNELAELVRTADLFVAPSRGEGFGLPLAEATRLGVPIVTTNFSGPTDFCSDDTAWMVDYRLQSSSAHVTASGGRWAEPDLASLGRQMRAALSQPDVARDKVRLGQALLNAHFKWSDVVRRVALSVAGVAHNRVPAAATSSRIDVDLVSTWNQVCGIATYSEHLFSTAALAPTLRRVMARALRGDGLPDGMPHLHHARPDSVSRPWAYEAEGIKQLAGELRTGTADVLWFQHHPGFFSDGDMGALTAALDNSVYKCKAITLHNVQETLQQGRGGWLSAFDTIFVHTDNDSRLISERAGLVATLIPHGILQAQAAQAASTGFTVGTFGFLYPHKNVPLLVEAVGIARRAVPDIRLSITTSTRPDPVSLIERVRVETLIDELGLGDAVDAEFRFLDDDALLARLGACDLLCFPYGESLESATGAARIALAVDRPILCSRSSVMTDILPYAIVLEKPDATYLAEALLLLSASKDLLHVRDTARRAFVSQTSYDAVAERYLKMFQHSLKGH